MPYLRKNMKEVQAPVAATQCLTACSDSNVRPILAIRERLIQSMYTDERCCAGRHHNNAGRCASYRSQHLIHRS